MCVIRGLSYEGEKLELARRIVEFDENKRWNYFVEDY